MSQDLKAFLESRSFPELIAEHAQESITIRVDGVEAKAIAARPYTIGTGYRCQIFASADYPNARQKADEVRALKLDSVYVVDDDNLYKVQVGNYTERRQAEITLDRLKYAGINGAWIVQTDIHIPKTQMEMQAIEDNRVAREEAARNSSVYYTIQVFATTDRSKAEQLQRVVENDYNQPTEIIRQKSFWKVLIGRFSDRNDAEDFLKVLKRQKFSDAWITQKTAI